MSLFVSLHVSILKQFGMKRVIDDGPGFNSSVEAGPFLFAVTFRTGVVLSEGLPRR
jgi:hypothetical protein